MTGSTETAWERTIVRDAITARINNLEDDALALVARAVAIDVPALLSFHREQFSLASRSSRRFA